MAMDRETGLEILGVDDVEQAIETILNTVPGERVMRADYGSELRRLSDVPMNASGQARIAQATAGALRTHEPRVRISKVAHGGEPGELVTTVTGTMRATGAPVSVRRE